MSTPQQTKPTDHPLDPLTADEFRQAAGILRRDRGVGARWRFASIELREPGKDALRVAPPGPPLPREALAVCWDRDTGQAYRAVLSLTTDSVLSWTPLPGQQPNITVDEWHECDEMLRADPALATALAGRGITDLSRVLTDLWAYPAATDPAAVPRPAAGLGRRLVPGQRAGQPVRAPPSAGCTRSWT